MRYYFRLGDVFSWHISFFFFYISLRLQPSLTISFFILSFRSSSVNVACAPVCSSSCYQREGSRKDWPVKARLGLPTACRPSLRYACPASSSIIISLFYDIDYIHFPSPSCLIKLYRLSYPFREFQLPCYMIPSCIAYIARIQARINERVTNLLQII